MNDTELVRFQAYRDENAGASYELVNKVPTRAHDMPAIHMVFIGEDGSKVHYPMSRSEFHDWIADLTRIVGFDA